MSFHHLPSELVLDILLWAAGSDTKTALRVTCVSQHIHRWTIPQIYHSIRLNSTKSILALSRTLKDTPDLATAIHHLSVFALGPAHAIQRLISLVPRVQSLIVGFPLSHLSPSVHDPEIKDGDGGDLYTQLPLAQEQHFLGMSCRDGFSRILSLVPPCTTHLRLNLSASTPASLPTLVELPAALPGLTHLAFVGQRMEGSILLPIIQSILARYESLQVLLLQCHQGVNEWNETATRDGDIRLVAETAPPSLAKLEWEPRQSCSKMWTGAEIEVERRRAERQEYLVSLDY